jgi:PIN domain nuclease of toxin-antitoxin system
LKGYLLDTNIILLALAAPEKLSGSIKKAIERGPNHLSVISYWEVLLKSGKGKLLIDDTSAWWQTAQIDLAATALPLRSDHVARIPHLSTFHQDPFDRVLIAQAIVEELTLVTTDAEIARYTSDGVKVLR